MSVDHLRYEWWLDDEGHPWVRHDCPVAGVDEWWLPPPWTLRPDGLGEGSMGITPSLACSLCGAHTILNSTDRRERLAARPVNEERP